MLAAIVGKGGQQLLTLYCGAFCHIRSRIAAGLEQSGQPSRYRLGIHANNDEQLYCSITDIVDWL